MKMYIYSNETNEHVATVVGYWDKVTEALTAAEKAGYNTNDYSMTFTAAFGATDGLVENSNAVIIISI